MLVRIVAFVVPLAFDSFAVAIALGLRGTGPWRPALVFAAFETVMPIVGIVVGRFAGERFAAPATVVGGLVLIGVGVHAFREALEEDDESAGLSFGSLQAAAIAGVGISMDELAVGFPLGTARLPIVPLLAAIGAQAFVATAGGILLGRRIGEALGRRATRFCGIAAGVAFGAVGLWLIVEPLMRRRALPLLQGAGCYGRCRQRSFMAFQPWRTLQVNGLGITLGGLCAVFACSGHLSWNSSAEPESATRAWIRGTLRC